ncbi:MAG: helix-turn-helix domain-containing protein [Actinomycetota bacterium]|nr:helix-turn-helix domain-containing protein [Actinomycetota bacterium]
METRWLEQRLKEGASFEAIGRELAMDPSTVAYWARKHGLASSFAERHAARGGLERAKLEALVADGLTVREIAVAVDRSAATVRHWLKRYGLRTDRLRRSAMNGDPGADEQIRICRHHGETAHRLRADGAYRCRRCNSVAVAEWRRRVKVRLVAEAGGCCVLCGYSRHPAVLQFHHRDPATKLFGIGSRGLGRAWADLRSEAAKCALLCPTCHAEVGLGVATLPSTGSFPG